MPNSYSIRVNIFIFFAFFLLQSTSLAVRKINFFPNKCAYRQAMPTSDPAGEEMMILGRIDTRRRNRSNGALITLIIFVVRGNELYTIRLPYCSLLACPKFPTTQDTSN